MSFALHFPSSYACEVLHLGGPTCFSTGSVSNKWQSTVDAETQDFFYLHGWLSSLATVSLSKKSQHCTPQDGFLVWKLSQHVCLHLHVSVLLLRGRLPVCYCKSSYTRQTETWLHQQSQSFALKAQILLLSSLSAPRICKRKSYPSSWGGNLAGGWGTQSTHIS